MTMRKNFTKTLESITEDDDPDKFYARRRGIGTNQARFHNRI
ncbi:MAG TPA: hypothetical protein VIP70_12745 [Nitrososphaeraceae archaeon]